MVEIIKKKKKSSLPHIATIHSHARAGAVKKNGRKKGKDRRGTSERRLSCYDLHIQFFSHIFAKEIFVAPHIVIKVDKRERINVHRARVSCELLQEISLFSCILFSCFVSPLRSESTRRFIRTMGKNMRNYEFYLMALLSLSRKDCR